MREPDYSRDDIVRALREVGLREGDVAFSHSSVAMLGIPAEGLNEEAIGAAFESAFREVLGDDGVLVLPAYTYSYTKGEAFDPETTPPTPAMGVLPNALWRRPDAVRTLDPLFSVVALGARAHELLDGVATDNCFGPRSIYARLLERDAAMINIGIGSHSALIHHVEQKLGVPYRFIKVFRGETRGQPTEVAYNVRALDEPAHFPYFMRLDRDARADGAVQAARLGRGEVNLIRARDMERLIVAGLARDPGYLVRGASAPR